MPALNPGDDIPVVVLTRRERERERDNVEVGQPGLLSPKTWTVSVSGVEELRVERFYFARNGGVRDAAIVYRLDQYVVGQDPLEKLYKQFESDHRRSHLRISVNSMGMSASELLWQLTLNTPKCILPARRMNAPNSQPYSYPNRMDDRLLSKSISASDGLDGARKLENRLDELSASLSVLQRSVVEQLSQLQAKQQALDDLLRGLLVGANSAHQDVGVSGITAYLGTVVGLAKMLTICGLATTVALLVRLRHRGLINV